jgi:hypothetical protein
MPLAFYISKKHEKGEINMAKREYETFSVK